MTFTFPCGGASPVPPTVPSLCPVPGARPHCLPRILPFASRSGTRLASPWLPSVGRVGGPGDLGLWLVNKLSGLEPQKYRVRSRKRLPRFRVQLPVKTPLNGALTGQWSRPTEKGTPYMARLF